MWSSGLREGFGTLFFADSSLMVGHWKNDAFYYGEFQRSDGTLISGKWTRESLSEGKVRDEFGNIFTGVFNEKGGIWKALTSCKPRCLHREIFKQSVSW